MEEKIDKIEEQEELNEDLENDPETEEELEKDNDDDVGTKINESAAEIDEKESKLDPFKETIKNYLDEKALADDLFAVTYSKPNKSINGCVNYIYDSVQKSGRKGFNDIEIFNMAVHYYDEDDIKELKGSKNGTVVVNHSIELTEEEKKAAHEKAVREVIEDEKKKFKKKPNQKPKVNIVKDDKALQEIISGDISKKEEETKPAFIQQSLF